MPCPGQTQRSAPTNSWGRGGGPEVWCAEVCEQVRFARSEFRRGLIGVIGRAAHDRKPQAGRSRPGRTR